MDTFIFYPNPTGDDQHVLLHTIRAQNPSAGLAVEVKIFVYCSLLLYFILPMQSHYRRVPTVCGWWSALVARIVADNVGGAVPNEHSLLYQFS